MTFWLYDKLDKKNVQHQKYWQQKSSRLLDEISLVIWELPNVQQHFRMDLVCFLKQYTIFWRHVGAVWVKMNNPICLDFGSCENQ